MELSDDLKKAQFLVTDKNNSLTILSKQTGISYPTLKLYRANPDRLRMAAWEKVNILAHHYDQIYNQP